MMVVTIAVWKDTHLVESRVDSMDALLVVGMVPA